MLLRHCVLHVNSQPLESAVCQTHLPKRGGGDLHRHHSGHRTNARENGAAVVAGAGSGHDTLHHNCVPGCRYNSPHSVQRHDGGFVDMQVCDGVELSAKGAGVSIFLHSGYGPLRWHNCNLASVPARLVQLLPCSGYGGRSQPDPSPPEWLP